MRCHSLCILSHFRRVWPFVTTWTVACQTSLSMGFSREEYWNGLPCPPPGDLLDPGIEPASLMSLALADKFFTTSTTWEAPWDVILLCYRYFLVTISQWRLKKPQGDDNACVNVNIGGGIGMCILSCVWLFATPWLEPTSLLCQWDFPWQKYWSGLPFPSPGCLPNPRIKPTSPVSPALAGRFFTTEPPGSLLLMRTLLQIYIKFNIWKAVHFYWLTYSKFTHNLNKTYQSLLYNLWSKYRL